MSISTEISRLEGAKSDLKLAIESYDVEVPDSAKIDEYFQYIQNIKKTTSFQITIPVSRWSNKTAVFSYTDYLDLNKITSSSYIEFAADDASAEEVINNNVVVSNGNTGNITFLCDTVPSLPIQGTVKIT